MEKKIVAVCACIAGVAHTYMASANLKKFAKKAGASIKVETQGAMGVEDRLSADAIAEADVVIFAVDTNVSDRDRFEGKKLIEVKTAEAVKDGENLIAKAIEMAE